MKPTLPILLLVLTTPFLNAYGERFVKQFPLGDRWVAVIAEGEQEPRSIGSYTVRIYEVLNPDFPTDSFVCGLVGARDGAVEQVILHELDGQGEKEIIVTIRCVGTGSFLSAHAYRYQDQALTRLAVVESSPKHTDPVEALKGKLHTP